MTVVLDKIQVLKEAYPSEAEFDRVLSKLLDNALGKYRLRLQRYEQDLRQFEHQYGMGSAIAYQRFEAGEMGDAVDFFEWAGMYELRQDLLEKIQRLELVL